MSGYFDGGSLGSLVGSWMWSQWRWPGVCATDIALMVLAALALAMHGPKPSI